MGDRRANGVTERAVQAGEEQLRVVRDGLQMRLGMKIRGRHPVMIWRIGHACDLLWNCQVRGDGKTGHRIPQGMNCSSDEVEFGEKVHLRLIRRHRPERLESRRLKKFFFGNMLLTGEAIFGTKNAFRKVGTIRRLRVHRIWDTERVGKCSRTTLEQDHPKELKIRWLSEEENGKDTEEATQNSNAYRHRVPRQDFSHHRCMESC